MMRRRDVLLRIAFVVICFLSVAGGAQQRPAKGEDSTVEKILIVYLPRTNNTKAIAEIIHEKAGGKLVALELERPYLADYHATVEQVAHEDEIGYTPPLKTKAKEANRLFITAPSSCCTLARPVDHLIDRLQIHSVGLGD